MRITGILVVLTVLIAWTAPGHATIVQQTSVSFDSDPSTPPNPEVQGFDRIEGATDADIDRDLFATIGGVFGSYSGVNAVGRFGNYGVEASQHVAGQMHTQVYISADITMPIIGGGPRPAEAGFIIDGGAFDFLTYSGSLLEFTLTLQVDGGTVFQSWYDLETLVDFAPPTVTSGGTDIGLTQDAARPYHFDIPFSFQKASLGLLNPGQTIQFEYQLDIYSTLPYDYPEIVQYSFQDPLTTTPPQSGPFRPTADFLTSGPPVPEPSSLVPFATAMALLGFSTWRRAVARRGR